MKVTPLFYFNGLSLTTLKTTRPDPLVPVNMFARYQMYQTLLTTSITHKATEHILTTSITQSNRTYISACPQRNTSSFDKNDSPFPFYCTGFISIASTRSQFWFLYLIQLMWPPCDLKYQTQEQEVCLEKRISQLSIFNLKSSDPSG